MVNEVLIKNLLSKWLEHFKVAVWWDQKNIYNYSVFKSSIWEKPDLIIGRNNRFFAIEVKNASTDSNYLDSFTQIINYAQRPYVYSIQGRHINIFGFLIATENSIKGYLPNEDKIAPPSEGRKWAAMHRQIPINEYRITKMNIRELWRMQKENNIDAAVGGLLSNILNDQNSIAPLLFYKKGKKQTYEVWT